MDTFKDPSFLAKAKAQHYDVSPISGEEMAALIDELGKTPKPVIERVAALIQPPDGKK